MFKIGKNEFYGIGLVVGLVILTELIAPYFSFLGGEALAMLLGIVLGNTLFASERYASGVKWSEKYPIEIGIALLGLTVTLKTIESLGITGVLFILVQVTLTIVFVIFLGKKIFKTPLSSTLMMASGNAVCGSSAIAATAPAVEAEDTQRRSVMATVSLVGVFLLFLLPAIGPSVVGKDNQLLGALIGGTVQSVGQVVGTASLVNPEVVTYATLFKMLRVILLAVVVLILGKYYQKQTQDRHVTATILKKRPPLAPWFIIVFVLLLCLNSTVSFPPVVNSVAKQISGYLGVMNLAAIGLNLKLETIRKSGGKYLTYGLLVAGLQALLAIGLIHLLLV